MCPPPRVLEIPCFSNLTFHILEIPCFSNYKFRILVIPRSPFPVLDIASNNQWWCLIGIRIDSSLDWCQKICWQKLGKGKSEKHLPYGFVSQSLGPSHFFYKFANIRLWRLHVCFVFICERVDSTRRSSRILGRLEIQITYFGFLLFLKSSLLLIAHEALKGGCPRLP